MSLPEPVLHATPILSLRPSQISVGMQEVRRKRDQWRKKTSTDLATFLKAHMVPTILGPRGEHYIIDHHHLALALHEESVDSVFGTVIADLSCPPTDPFWNMMDFHGWSHPYDAKGRRRPFSDLPKTVAGMEDDPYRSLAGELRYAGGFAKDSTPFAEFLWADFFRPRIKAKTIRLDSRKPSGRRRPPTFEAIAQPATVSLRRRPVPNPGSMRRRSPCGRKSPDPTSSLDCSTRRIRQFIYAD